MKYCKECGARLLALRTSDQVCYDTLSGVESRYAKYRCPNKKHWWDFHTQESFGGTLTIPLYSLDK